MSAAAKRAQLSVAIYDAERLRCPFCRSRRNYTVDCRDTTGAFRRRYECLDCRKRFTTYERIEDKAVPAAPPAPAHQCCSCVTT